MWIFLLILLISAVLVYPYVAVVICRYKAIARMRVTVRRSGGRMRILRKLAAFSRNRASKYDILVEKDDVLYAIKLWACAHKNTDIRIYSDGSVGEERNRKDPLLTKRSRSKAPQKARYAARRVNKTEYNFKIPNGKKIVNVLMMYPTYRNVIFERKGVETTLHTGDVFFDKIIFTPYAFCKMLLDSEVRI